MPYQVDLTLLFDLLGSSTFLSKLLLAYFLFRGMAIYSLGENLLIRQVFTAVIFLCPQAIIQYPISLILGMCILFPVSFWEGRLAAFPEIIKSMLNNQMHLIGLVLLTELMWIEWTLTPKRSLPEMGTVYSLISRTYLVLPAVLYGIYLDMVKANIPRKFLSVLSPLISLKILLPQKKYLSVGLILYQWAVLCFVLLIGNFQLPPIVFILLNLSFFLCLNFAIRHLAKRHQKLKIKQAWISSRRKKIH